MADFEHLYWWSHDGLRLHARDYAGGGAKDGGGRPPILCLPGLTRNARDFEEIAQRLSPDWRVIAVDLRGRGESAYATDPTSYAPLTYVQDVEALLAAIGVDRFVAFGTSLGGIVTMLMAAATPGRLAGALLNDIGPEIEAAGLARIRSYVGKPSVWPTWMHAARAVREGLIDAYPDWDIMQWLAMAKRLYRLKRSGRIVLDYDLRIAEPFRASGGEAAPDLWPMLAGLAEAPVLVVRGDRSDILSPATAARMISALDGAELVTVPRVGHAPTLSEPEASAAIDRLLARVAARPATR